MTVTAVTLRPDVLARLALKSRQTDAGCLVWTGTCSIWGYGVVRVDGKRTTVHRAAWIARNGMPPEQTPSVLHHCDNPPCWAEDHLFLGTHDDNMADKAAKNRAHNQFEDATHCKHGHEFTPENTRIGKRGERNCRQCKRDRARVGGSWTCPRCRDGFGSASALGTHLALSPCRCAALHPVGSGIGRDPAVVFTDQPPAPVEQDGLFEATP